MLYGLLPIDLFKRQRLLFVEVGDARGTPKGYFPVSLSVAGVPFVLSATLNFPEFRPLQVNFSLVTRHRRQGVNPFAAIAIIPNDISSL